MKIRTSHRDFDNDSFSFYVFVGWGFEQEHYDLMATKEWGEFRNEIKPYMKLNQMYHAEVTKIHGGDW